MVMMKCWRWQVWQGVHVVLFEDGGGGIRVLCCWFDQVNGLGVYKKNGGLLNLGVG